MKTIIAPIPIDPSSSITNRMQHDYQKYPCKMIGKSVLLQNTQIRYEMALNHEVNRRDRRTPRRKIRGNHWNQTVLKIQKRADWNFHLHRLWDYRIFLIKKCGGVLAISIGITYQS